MTQYQSQGFSMMPPAVKHLLIINILAYLAYEVLAMQRICDLNALLGLWSLNSGQFRIWQPLTYMFMHANFSHIFFNMFSLWMFGRAIENMWGTRRFLIYYFACGIGAGLLYLLVPGLHVTVGASAAVYGILLAFGMTFPKDYVYVMIWMLILIAASILLQGTAIGAFLDRYSIILFLMIFFIGGRTGKGLVRIQNRWFIIAKIAIELVMGLFIIDGVAHFAHLGGMLIGFLLILYWRKHPFSRF